MSTKITDISTPSPFAYSETSAQGGDYPTMAEKIAALNAAFTDEDSNCACQKPYEDMTGDDECEHGVRLNANCYACEKKAEFIAALGPTGMSDPTKVAPIALGPATWEDALDRVLAEMRAVMVERRTKYGPKNVLDLGLYGVLSRALHDKGARIMGALNGKIVNGEVRLYPIEDAETADTIEDGLIDLANYAGPIALMVMRGWWALPREQE